MTASPRTLRVPLTLVVLLAATLAGCATAPRRPKEDVVWPPPPDLARIKYVRSFASVHDLKAGSLQTALRLFVPPSPDAVVAQPTGLALSPDERYLYVSCSSAGHVLRVDLLGKQMDIVADQEGRRPGAPFSVAVDAEGVLYVSDKVQEVVWAYGADGRFLRRLGSGVLDNPTGIAIDRRRQILYVVAGAGPRSEAHRVEVFSLAGEHLRTIGRRGSGPGEFNFPTNLTVAPDGTLYVVDMLNFRIQLFDPEGQLIGMFGTIGAGQPGTFDKAKSIALDSFGNIYVVDSQQAWVQIFNPSFQPLMAFGGRARLPGYLATPTAIAITSKNTIFVADFASGIVNEYVLINTSASDSAPPAAGKTGGDGGMPSEVSGEKPQDG